MTSNNPNLQPPTTTPSTAAHTDPNPPHPPLPPTFRPTFPTRSSYNYAQAEATARSEKGAQASSDAFTARKASVDYGDQKPSVDLGEQEGEGKGGSGGKGEGKGGSWSEQEMKRVMQQRLLVGEGGREGGFTEK